MADQQRLTDMMFGLVWPPTSPEAVKRRVVADLVELQALRGDSLTDDEYESWKAGILDGLAANRHHEAAMLLVPVLYGVVSVGLLVYFVMKGDQTWVVGCLGGIAITGLLGLRLARGLAVKRGLSIDDRLAVVAELQARGLVTDDEAERLRGRIRELPAA